jgi:galactose mutarotase-like enzyme
MAITGIGEVYTISEGKTTVSVDSHGAKVLSIAVGERELLFYDENDIGHSGIPLCFPSFGPLENGEFRVDETAYPMNQHGFIRDSSFEITKNDPGLLTCVLKSNDDTKKHYPFDFEFTVTYRVLKTGLAIRFQWKNEDTKTVPLAPGVHPYFAVENPEAVSFTTGAVSGNDNSNDYELTLIEDSPVFSILEELDNGLCQLAVKGAPDMHLTNHNLEATIIETGHAESVVMESDPEVFNRMTIWRKTKTVPYICVEPAYAQNGLNEEPIEIKPTNCFDTVLAIQLNN